MKARVRGWQAPKQRKSSSRVQRKMKAGSQEPVRPPAEWQPLNKKRITHGIYSNYYLSNTIYLDTTLPIYCFFQQYPDFFEKVNYFASLNESDVGEIIFRFIRRHKEQEQKMDGTKRSNIQIGSEVEIVEKHNQRSGDLTDGFVERILTKSSNHPHGIKVLLETGEVGRVKNIIADPLEDM